MTMLKSIISNGFWSLIGSSLGKMAMFLTNILVARILPQEVFGQFTTIRNTITMMDSFISGTFSTTSTKFIAENKDGNRRTQLIYTLFIINFSVAFILSLLLLLCSDYLILHFFADEDSMKIALRIGGVLLVGTVLSTVLQSILVGLELFKKIAIIGVIVPIIALPTIIFSVYNFGLEGAVGGVALYFILDFLVKLIFLYRFKHIKKIKISFNELTTTGKKIIRFSSPLFFAVLLNSVGFWYARILLINNTDSFEEIAIFDAAYQWLTIVMIITSSTTNVALPMFSKAVGTKEKTQINKVFRLNIIINLIISLIVSAIFILFSQTIMSLYGNDYIKGVNVLIILCVTSIFFTLATVYNRYMMSINMTRSLLVVAILGIVGLYLILWLFEPSIITLAIGFLTYYIISVVYYFIFKRRLKS